MSRHPLILLTLTASLAIPGCFSRRSTPEPTHSGGGYSAMANQNENMDAMIARGEVGLWVSPPIHFKERAFYGVHRGPSPTDYAQAMPSSRGSFSKISKRHGMQTAMVTLYAIDPDGEDEIFGKTPFQIVELEFLTPKPPVAPPIEDASRAPDGVVTAPAAPATKGAATTADPTQEIHVHVHTQPHTHPAQVNEEAPVYVPDTLGGRVGKRVGHWQVNDLEHDLVLACVVLREKVKNKEGEEVWKYHGEVWIKNLTTGAIFRHEDPTLEPSSWQLHPGPTPRVEVVMADSKGWPRRVDLIDLNKLQVRALTARDRTSVGASE